MADLFWLLPSIAIGIGMMLAMIKWPRIWIGSIFLVMPFFLSDSGAGFSASELALGGFIMASLCGWMVMRLLKPEPLILWWGDFLLLLFVVASLANLAVALLNNVEITGWFSEWSLFLLMLLYFPIRELFGVDEERLRQLLIILAVSTVLMALYSLWSYKTRAAEGGMIYAYQLLASRSRLFGSVFSFGVLVGIAALFHSKTLKAKLLIFGTILLTGAGLIQSFTRSLWAITAVSVLMMALFLSWKQNLALALSALCVAFGTYLAANAINPTLTSIALKIVENRINTTTQLKGGDYSFEGRVIEAEAAQRHIDRYPLGGSGIRAKKVSWDPITQTHGNTSFIHFGYLSIIFKVGYPMAVLYLLIWLMFSWKAVSAFWHNRKDKTSFARGVALGNFCFIPALYVNFVFAGMVDQRYGNVMLAVMFALAMITYQIAQKRNDEAQELAA